MSESRGSGHGWLWKALLDVAILGVAVLALKAVAEAALHSELAAASMARFQTWRLGLGDPEPGTRVSQRGLVEVGAGRRHSAPPTGGPTVLCMAASCGT